MRECFEMQERMGKEITVEKINNMKETIMRKNINDKK